MSIADDAVWMLRKRLAESGRLWPQDGDGARWLRWSMVMGAARMLRCFREEMPSVSRLREHCWRERHTGNIPEVAIAPGEDVFLRLGMAFMAHHLVRKPEFGPDWNAAMAQRREARLLAAYFERNGRQALALEVLEKMPKARARPTDREWAVLPGAQSPQIPHPGAVLPAAPAPATSPVGRGQTP